MRNRGAKSLADEKMPDKLQLADNLNVSQLSIVRGSGVYSIYRIISEIIDSESLDVEPPL